MRDVIIGGGIGGLTAASYLGRFRRTALVVDAGASRARWIPESHNIPGFPEGIGGTTLLSRLRTQATRYGAEMVGATVESVRHCDGGFALTFAGRIESCRFLLIASGVEDVLPELPGAAEALLRSLLRVCPVCDGYEAIGQRIAVVGNGREGEKEAQFLRTYSDRVTYLYVGTEPDPQRRPRLAEHGIALVETALESLNIEAGALRLQRKGGDPQVFDTFYSALGCRPRVSLITALGAECDERRAVKVSAHQQTSVPGLYAVGDMVRGLNQVVVAAAEAAMAATDIHNRLRAG